MPIIITPKLRDYPFSCVLRYADDSLGPFKFKLNFISFQNAYRLPFHTLQQAFITIHPSLMSIFLLPLLRFFFLVKNGMWRGAAGGGATCEKADELFAAESEEVRDQQEPPPPTPVPGRYTHPSGGEDVSSAFTRPLTVSQHQNKLVLLLKFLACRFEQAVSGFAHLLGLPQV